MAKTKMTLTRAYAKLGATVTSPRQAWARIADDGKSVIVTVWRDDPDAPPPDEITVSTARPHARGNRNRIKVLGHALAHCKGLFRVIWLTREDRSAIPPTIKGIEPDQDRWMRVTSLDAETGTFTATRVL
jgi:hypothetical protein